MLANLRQVDFGTKGESLRDDATRYLGSEWLDEGNATLDRAHMMLRELLIQLQRRPRVGLDLEGFSELFANMSHLRVEFDQQISVHIQRLTEQIDAHLRS